MPTKQTPKSRRLLEKRTKLETVLLVTLMLIIIYLLLAMLVHWWPFNTSRYGDKNLGSAFYTALDPNQANGTSGVGNSSGGGDGSGSGSNGSNGSNGSSGSNGSNGNGGGTSTPTTSGSALLTFAADLDKGDSKSDVNGRVGNLNQNCALLVDSSSAGKQEVCVYTEGDKIVTVTYLNDQVVSASRSGF